MRVANIIIAHKNPRQVARLINQFDGSLFHNFIHIDGKSDLRDFREVAANPNVTLVPRRKVVFAGYSLVDVPLRALYQIKKGDEKFFYYNLMSGMDFPIRPTIEFYDFLKATHQSDPKEFFEILDLSVWPGAHRFERYHLPDWTIKGRYFTERIINRFIPKRKFYFGKFTPYGRSQWFTASDHFIDYFMKYIEDHPDYLKFLKTVWGADELVFNSLVMNSPFKDKIAPYLRYIDWSEGKVHPKVFRIADAAELLASGCFIARKFDESVDDEIIGYIEKAITRPSGGI